jgi:hypothetical protein
LIGIDHYGIAAHCRLAMKGKQGLSSMGKVNLVRRSASLVRGLKRRTIMTSLKPKYFVFLSLVALLGSAGVTCNGRFAPPTATVVLQRAYTDSPLRGSATFSNPNGDLEGISTYRWLVNGSH